jgi:hypothetical protein
MDFSTGLEDLNNFGIKKYPTTIKASTKIELKRDFVFIIIVFQFISKLNRQKEEINFIIAGQLFGLNLSTLSLFLIVSG